MIFKRLQKRLCVFIFCVFSSYSLSGLHLEMPASTGKRVTSGLAGTAALALAIYAYKYGVDHTEHSENLMREEELVRSLGLSSEQLAEQFEKFEEEEKRLEDEKANFKYLVAACSLCTLATLANTVAFDN